MKRSVRQRVKRRGTKKSNNKKTKKSCKKNMKKTLKGGNEDNTINNQFDGAKIKEMEQEILKIVTIPETNTKIDSIDKLEKIYSVCSDVSKKFANIDFSNIKNMYFKSNDNEVVENKIQEMTIDDFQKLLNEKDKKTYVILLIYIISLLLTIVNTILITKFVENKTPGKTVSDEDILNGPMVNIANVYYLFMNEIIQRIQESVQQSVQQQKSESQYFEGSRDDLCKKCESGEIDNNSQYCQTCKDDEIDYD